MAEQARTPKAGRSNSHLDPVEGRVDVAGDVEEEKRNAYSSHHKDAAREKRHAGEDQRVPAAAANYEPQLPPVEGRVDVAGDKEEEERNAYSSHHQ